MIKVTTENLLLNIDESKISSLQLIEGQLARRVLAKVWAADTADLSNYLAVFYDKKLAQLSEDDSFITLSFHSHGYIADANEAIEIQKARQQIEIDLEIINREAQLSPEESIYFEQWWPEPVIDRQKKILEFGVSLKDFYQIVFNRTLNRIMLTRFGHLSLNYTLSETAVANALPLSNYQQRLDEIILAMTVGEGFRYEDINEDDDIPSRSRLINLILSAEIF